MRGRLKKELPYIQEIVHLRLNKSNVDLILLIYNRKYLTDRLKHCTYDASNKTNQAACIIVQAFQVFTLLQLSLIYGGHLKSTNECCQKWGKNIQESFFKHDPSLPLIF